MKKVEVGVVQGSMPQAMGMYGNMNNTSIGNLSNLSQGVAGGSAERTSESAMEEICPISGDPVVAYSRKSGRLVCNQCIYNEMAVNSCGGQDDLAPDSIDFTAHVASELKELFDDKFHLYKNQLNKMNEIAPKTISKQLETTV